MGFEAMRDRGATGAGAEEEEEEEVFCEYRCGLGEPVPGVMNNS